MKKATVLVLALGAALVLAAGLAACGGSSGSGTSSSEATGVTPAPRATATLSQALIGHWKSAPEGAGGGVLARETDMYFDGQAITSVPAGGGAVVFKYVTKSEDTVTREIMLAINRVLPNGTIQAGRQQVRVTFLNDQFTRLQTAGITFAYVGPKERP